MYFNEIIKDLVMKHKAYIDRYSSITDAFIYILAYVSSDIGSTQCLSKYIIFKNWLV